jgi:hypothetical protein
MRMEREKGRNRKRRRCLLEPLEPRILLSGDGMLNEGASFLPAQSSIDLQTTYMEVETDVVEINLSIDTPELQGSITEDPAQPTEDGEAYDGELSSDDTFDGQPFTLYDTYLNPIDWDQDGYARSFDLEFEVYAGVPGSYYVDLYQVGLEGGDTYLTQSDVFAVDGDTFDYQILTLDSDAYSDLFSSGTVGLRLDLYAATTVELMQTWTPNEDADLGGIPVELSSDDTFDGQPYLDSRINPIEWNEDGSGGGLDLKLEVYPSVPVRYYLGVSSSAGENFVVQSADLAAATASAKGGDGSGESILTTEAVTPAGNEATLRWTQVLAFQLNEACAAPVYQTSFKINDIEGSSLGQMLGTQVTIDADVAGSSWFSNSASSSDSELQGKKRSAQQLTTPSSAAYGETDLLTATGHDVPGQTDGDTQTSASQGPTGETLDIGESPSVRDSGWHPQVVANSIEEASPSAVQTAAAWQLALLTDTAGDSSAHPNREISVTI